MPSPDRDRDRRPQLEPEATPAAPTRSEHRACASRHHAPRRAPGTTTAPAAHPPPPRRRREGKKNVPDISAQAGLLVPPREVLVIPPKEKTTYARDLMITKHMSKLTKAGRW